MNFVFLYGPPAVGKITVGRELANLTGYKLFHNHLSVDFVCSLFFYGSEEFYELLNKIRIEAFESAAKVNISGMIFTFVYDPKEDNEFVQNIDEVLKTHNSTLMPVRLFAPKETLEERVENESRKEFKKTGSKESLHKILSSYSAFDEVEGYKSLSIDTSKYTPEEAARTIADHYLLPRDNNSQLE